MKENSTFTLEANPVVDHREHEYEGDRPTGIPLYRRLQPIENLDQVQAVQQLCELQASNVPQAVRLRRQPKTAEQWVSLESPGNELELEDSNREMPHTEN